MSSYLIEPSQLKGSLHIPASKSQTLRAILFAALAEGATRIFNPLDSPDVEAMIQACSYFGAHIIRFQDHLEVVGLNGKLSCCEDVIQAGNSGIVLRFIGAIAALSSYPVVITGDYSLRHQRPARPLLRGLEQLGVKAFSLREDDYAPLFIKGPLCPGSATIDGEDSQPVSALLIASAFACGPISLSVLNPGEKPWVDLTLSWFDRLGIPYERQGHSFYRLNGKARIKGFSYHVPGDLSTCAFPLAAALVTHSKVTLTGVEMSDHQGDKELITLLQKTGASIETDPKNHSLQVNPSAKWLGGRIDINSFVDALPILATLACFAHTETEIVGAKIARTKECDRLSCITQELRKMGAEIEEREDGLLIKPSQLTGASVFSHADHRMAMSLAVAALGAKGKTQLNDPACVAKTYPAFFSELERLGANIR